MGKIAILIMAHKPIKYFEGLARDNQQVNFFVHMDIKTNFVNPEIKNLYFLKDELRVDVKWGGFSQVQATLNLLSFVFHNSDSEFFHVVSGEDVILSTNKNLSETLTWSNSNIFMELMDSPRHRYRVRFFAPHVETRWQRKLVGKLFTFSLKILDKIFITKKDFWFGSNWFSIRREELKIILNSITDRDISLFKHRLNPDEHFFQYIVVKAGLRNNISLKGNNRYIIFDKRYNNGNNPIYLNADQLLKLKNTCSHFFARKVDIDNQLKYYERVNF
ncbi:beta-1,6-N-acetylglucosaminyltransferase [Acinetobacter baumannii]|uniref:beta-1,6-N-acetylglucosaminyltransferase n=1 Tax=Acinetobacter baumannii TaxID=470 RepID=UPI0012E264F0|nr:beta-1,6-N-acetylglucosaminyltransferase [Acinetobacter baumannii]MUT43745.1 glycogen branching protein [Acinetobacter baumannii]